MISRKYHLSLIVSICYVFFIAASMVHAQDDLPVREYTNPDEVVTFDRSTPFSRALDVINEFSQEKSGKMIVDRTQTSGEIGIAVPPMHWKEALDLILNVKGLVLVEREDFFEILTQSPEGAAQEGEGLTAAGEDTLKATTTTKEVRINAIFFEGSRRALREVGVDWSTLTDNVPGNVSDFTGDQPSESLPTTGFDPDGPFVQVNSRGARSVSQNVFNALVNLGDVGNTGIEVQALFSAFEADNLGEILASPNIKVMDGELGSIQVGQDFSIKQRDFAGNVTDKFFQVGTILEVTPQVISNKDTTFIHLEIKAERSSAQPDPVSTIINKQEAETQAILLNGEATAIAGLYRTEQSEVRRGVPVLKDLPAWFFGLRYLFGFNSTDYQMRELVILIQASIVPDIRERYANRENLDSRFEILEKERNKILEDIIDKGESSASMIGNSEIEDLEEGYQEEQEPDTMDRENKRQEKHEKETEEKTDKQPAPAKDKEEESDPVVTDPEIKQEEVPLNLGAQVQGDTTGVQEIQKEGTYHLIAASFQNKKNAEDYRDELIKEGFDSQILEDRGSNFLLVTYRSYDNLEKAKSALEDLKEYRNADAWLYEVK